MFGTRVVIADSDPLFRKALKEVFRHVDYLVVGEAADAHGALQIVFQHEPSVVVLDPSLPGTENMDVAGIIEEHRVAPVVVAISLSRGEIEDYARTPGVYGVLIKPLQEITVQPVIESAMANFERSLRLAKEIKELRKELENRKLLERAKGLLMEKKSMSEREAHKYIQKLSMDKCVPVAKVAKNIIIYYQKH